MAFTYTSPADSDLCAVRWWVGDTDSADVQLQDAEITFAINQTGNVKRAASYCARALAAKYSREVNMRVGAGGELRIDLAQLAKAYIELAEFLESSAASYAAPWAASISIDEKDSQREDTDRVKPFFDRSMFSGQPSSTNEILDWNERRLD